MKCVICKKVEINAKIKSFLDEMCPECREATLVILKKAYLQTDAGEGVYVHNDGEMYAFTENGKKEVKKLLKTGRFLDV